MEKKLTKGMVLCAGLGTRLHPITQSLPKPLVPVLNVPNILHSLFMMKRAGVTEIILNVHHLPEMIEDYLGDGRRWGLKLAYSREKILLGTGGGVKKAEAFFKGEHFLLANCDFVTNLDITPFIERHFAKDALATMILFQDEAKQKSYSKVGVDREGRLCSLPRWQRGEPAKTGIFTGIHLICSKTLKYLKEEPCGINEILYPALMKETPDRVFGMFTDAYWYDTGDLKTFCRTSLELLDELEEDAHGLGRFLKEFGGYEEKTAGVWMPKGSRVPNGEVIGPSILGADCHLGKGSVIGPYAILADKSRVEDGVRVSHYIGLGAPRITTSLPKVSEGTIQFHERLLKATN